MIQPKKVFRTKDGRLGFEWNDGSRGACAIRDLRLAAGMTIRDVRAACGVSSAAVTKWQSGRALPTLDNMVVLADLWSVHIDDIIVVQTLQ